MLVEKDWCSFGYKFHGTCPPPISPPRRADPGNGHADRTGHFSSDCSDSERSPIFLQWLDVVWQVTRQYPSAFEFGEALLMEVADR